MELLLIRHALPIRRELDSGAADPELSDDGHRQAERLAQYLSSEHLDAVYASTMQRALQTAAPLAAGRDLDIVQCEGVAEFDKDSSSYVPVEELRAANDPRWKELLEGKWDGTEPQEDFAGRVIGAVEQIIDDHAGQRVAVVCHGGVINSYLASILQLTIHPVKGFFYPNYTSIHRVAASSRGDRTILTINETSHLRNSGLPMGLFQQG